MTSMATLYLPAAFSGEQMQNALIVNLATTYCAQFRKYDQASCSVLALSAANFCIAQPKKYRNPAECMRAQEEGVHALSLRKAPDDIVVKACMKRSMDQRTSAVDYAATAACAEKGK